MNREEGLTNSQKDDLEAALSDIILFGEPLEVEAARNCMITLTEEGGADFDRLIRELRTSLRAELGLEQTPMPTPYNLRMSRNT